MTTYKTIPGNYDFIISKDLEIKSLKDNVQVPEITIENDRKKIWIEIYGETVNVDLHWLYLIAHFETHLPDPSYEKLCNIEFMDIDSTLVSVSCHKVPLHKKPFSVKFNDEKYRIIPGFYRYAINDKGILLDIIRQTLIPVRMEVSKGFHNKNFAYPNVYIYNPDKGKFTTQGIHRLVALAWIPNNDFINKPIVNHKNGNKKDFRIKNLEWCSASYNVLHAVNIGLRSDNMPCKVRNFHTGEVTEFMSISQASEFMGLNSVLEINTIPKNPNYLLNDTYEFRLVGDKRPWFYEGKDKRIIGRYHITVTDPEGNVTHLVDAREFKKLYHLHNLPNLNEMVHVFKMKYPFHKVEVKDMEDHPPIQGLNVETNEILEFDTYRDMWKKTGTYPMSIQKRLERGEEYLGSDGYCFRYKSDKPWNREFKKFGNDDKVYTLVNRKTGAILTSTSTRSIAKTLDVARSTVKRAIYYGKDIMDWSIEVQDKYPYNHLIKDEIKGYSPY